MIFKKKQKKNNREVEDDYKIQSLCSLKSITSKYLSTQVNENLLGQYTMLNTRNVITSKIYAHHNGDREKPEKDQVSGKKFSLQGN